MVFNCGLCLQLIAQKPKQHYDIFHAGTLRFPCGESGCTSQYCVIKSLVRHIKYAHPAPRPIQVPAPEIPAPIIPVVPIELVQPIVEILPVSPVQPVLPPIPSRDSVREVAIWFLCELLSLPAVSFNRAFIITQRVLPLISPLLQLANRLLSFMPDSDDKTEMRELLGIFENPFDGVSTHYLLVKCTIWRYSIVCYKSSLIKDKHFLLALHFTQSVL